MDEFLTKMLATSRAQCRYLWRSFYLRLVVTVFGVFMIVNYYVLASEWEDNHVHKNYGENKNNTTGDAVKSNNSSNLRYPETVVQNEARSSMMGYNNLSCPFEWSKYSCSYIQENDFDKQVAIASLQYYQQHLTEIRQSFDSLLNKPTRIFMSGDSLLRQVFISLACNAHSLLHDNDVEIEKVQWSSLPCMKSLKNNTITGGEHGRFNRGSIRFTNGSEIHYVAHSGCACGGCKEKGEENLLKRFIEQINSMGTIDFGTKTVLPPSGPMDVLVYNVGIHDKKRKEEKLNTFANKIATPLMKKDLEGQRRPKIVYVTTPTQHFNTFDGQFDGKRKHDRKMLQCIEQVPHNPKNDLEKKIFTKGVNVDVLLDYDDLGLGGLHVHHGDCSHYCMPGVPDFVGARLLETIGELYET